MWGFRKINLAAGTGWKRVKLSTKNHDGCPALRGGSVREGGLVLGSLGTWGSRQPGRGRQRALSGQ